MSTDHRFDSVELVPASIVRPFARAAVFAALTGVAAIAELQTPLSPAPVTLQVLFVFLAGLYLGPVWGSISMLLYLAAGAVGAPVYSGGDAGLGILFGNTGGFLLSYPVAAFVIGVPVHGRAGLGLGSGWPWRPGERNDFFDRVIVRDPADAPLPVLVFALAVGALVVYAFGAAYVTILLDLSPATATVQYVVPFLPVEFLKLIAALLVVRAGPIDLT
ncbi:biotin transporter BioY [Halovivax cerinus]|uniref:Biotin transporter BioY n=1 Tax=Halovivax cerinus TaxID=1487865 RepID=A0ABD5NNT6_9EURY|nr:biotin transporter BioY [Halovivax cerinus]